MRIIDADALEDVIQSLNEKNWGITRADYKMIDAVLFEFPTITQNPDEWCTDCKEYDSEKHSCPRFNHVIRKAMEQRWIPVTERLPDEYKRVLVSDVFGVYVGEFVNAEENWGGEHFINEHGMHSKSVKAWMPLPEPYAERRTDETDYRKE